MAELNFSLRRKVRKIVKSHFKIKIDYHDKILFENRTNQANNFTLYCKFLTVHEILECSKIIVDVCKEVAKIDTDAILLGSNLRDLNRVTEDGARFLKSVIALDGTSLHKFLLLTSGEQLMDDERCDLLIQLAQVKKPTATDFKLMIRNRALYEFIDKLYLLPGVSETTDSFMRDSPIRMGFYSQDPEQSLMLMAFFANDSSVQTLGEFLKLDFIKAISETRNARSFKGYTSVPSILLSDYGSLAVSMTAQELVALSAILSGETLYCKLPEDFLRRRVEAMVNSQDLTTPQRSDSVIKYLSDAEMSLLTSSQLAELDSLLVPYIEFRRTYNPAVYAAIADVAAVKGQQKALAVARVLSHLQSRHKMTEEEYEATVLLILEALKPAGDLPFSWSVQLSEHAWVMNSHAEDE